MLRRWTVGSGRRRWYPRVTSARSTSSDRRAHHWDREPRLYSPDTALDRSIGGAGSDRVPRGSQLVRRHDDRCTCSSNSYRVVQRARSSSSVVALPYSEERAVVGPQLLRPYIGMRQGLRGDTSGQCRARPSNGSLQTSALSTYHRGSQRAPAVGAVLPLLSGCSSSGAMRSALQYARTTAS